MDFSLIVNERLGDLRFDYTEQEVVALLGKPDDIEHESDHKHKGSEYVTYYYFGYGLAVSFHKQQKSNEGMSVFSENVMLKGHNLYELKRKDILNLVEQVYKEEGLEQYFSLTQQSQTNEDTERLVFEELGVTLWFDGDMLDDVCVYHYMPESGHDAPYEEQETGKGQLAR